MSPFSRTSVIITLIVAGTIFGIGIIALIAFIPDSEGRITTALTITLPIVLIQIVNLFNQRKITRTVNSNSAKLDTTVAQTNGIVNRLLDHVKGQVTLDTTELAAIEARVNAVRGGQEEGK